MPMNRRGTTQSRARRPEVPFTPAFYVILFLLCLATYRGIFDNWLFNDDFSWLREARLGMSWGNLLTLRVVEFFRPLVNLSFYVMERISPGNLPLHYSFNLLLHFLNSLLVFHAAFALTGGRRLSAAASALFAVTSIHTGALFWISARTTLMSSFLLLSSLILVVPKGAGARAHVPPRGEGGKAGAAAGTAPLPGSGDPKAASRARLILSVALYVLALAAKETAVAGFPILLLILLLNRRTGAGISPDRPALAAFASATVLYLIARHSVMGGFPAGNWGFGAHAPRNVGGGILYQLYPWPAAALLFPRLGVIGESVHPFLPEMLALPLILLILWIGCRARRGYEFAAAAGWMILALVPASLFRYRFFSTASITQNRYYYLSSFGSVLIVALLLEMLWRGGSRIRRSAAAAVFLILCTGYIARVWYLEIKWSGFTEYYRQTVEVLLEEARGFPGVSTLAVEDPPLAHRYLKDAVAYFDPGWKVVEIRGGAAEAEEWKPCLYVTYSGEKTKMMRMRKLER